MTSAFGSGLDVPLSLWHHAKRSSGSPTRIHDPGDRWIHEGGEWHYQRISRSQLTKREGLVRDGGRVLFLRDKLVRWLESGGSS